MDIVERLRSHAVTGLDLEILETEAADEIELLRKERDGLREALQNKQRPDGESIQGVIAWIKEDQDRLMKFRAALKDGE